MNDMCINQLIDQPTHKQIDTAAKRIITHQGRLLTSNGLSFDRKLGLMHEVVFKEQTRAPPVKKYLSLFPGAYGLTKRLRPTTPPDQTPVGHYITNNPHHTHRTHRHLCDRAQASATPSPTKVIQKDTNFKSVVLLYQVHQMSFVKTK